MPCRLRDLRKAAREYGLECEEPSSGSHWKFRNAAGEAYTVPAHNGLKTEIGDEYINGLCRTFVIDRAAFKQKL